jgi:hypothetical protein
VDIGGRDLLDRIGPVGNAPSNKDMKYAKNPRIVIVVILAETTSNLEQP